MKIDTDDSGWSQYIIIDDIEKDDTERTLEIVRNKLQVQKQKQELRAMNQNDKPTGSSGVVTIYAISVFCLLSMYVGFLLYN
jgi:hypoxanthine phosphoribosyltransferase